MKTVLITGTTQGIGYELYKRFNNDYIVITINRREFPGNNLICDLSKLPEVADLCKRIKKYKIDILINNAGGGKPSLFQNLSFNTLQSCTNLNYHAPVMLMQAVLEGMKEHQYGRIINISSIASKSPRILIPHYGAAKAAMEIFSKSLAVAYADCGITINCLCPGGVETKTSIENRRIMAKLSGKESDSLNITISKSTGLGRMVSAEEVVETVAYFLSDKSKAISGQTLNVCGTMEVHS